NGDGTFTITNGAVGDFAGWAATSGVRVITGDFNGNGRTDIALVRQNAGWGSIPIAFSNGDGTFTITNGAVGDFAGWAATSGVRVITGDFNGNGRTDIALVRQDAGWTTVPVAFSAA
ncbi:MAG: VCBS repeat-containing protein, partial [Spirirestis rafaelensis WJT71-NPBG6]|nr:VCBS repeat-containing protein [Spirirestis rafaelensis WJT71-NPBG6]